MRDPTTDKFINIQRLMETGIMVGADRPVGRVTFAKQGLRSVTSTKHGVETVRYLAKNVPEHELVGIRTIDIDRSIGQDAATCGITMFNAAPKLIQPEGMDTSGNKGYLTFNRGEPVQNQTSVYNNFRDQFTDSPLTLPTGNDPDGGGRGWGYAPNPYRDVLIPNTVLRTYQGYGSQNFDKFNNPRDDDDPQYVEAKSDNKLYRTGVWLIDTVTYGADGMIHIECRDLAKLLIEQYIYPPMIPVSRFPLIYCPAHDSTGHKESIGRNVATFHSSSVDRLLGKNHPVHKHRGSDAFDGRPASYWLSAGNSSADDVAWLQARTHGTINEVALQFRHPGYEVYVSVHEDGEWKGTQTLTGSIENLDYEDSPGAAGSPGSTPGYFYAITSGDTLWDLSQRFYGRHDLWPLIARSNNNIKDPHWIYPGQRIRIPYVAGTLSAPPNTGTTRANIPYVAHGTVPHSKNLVIRLPRSYKANFVRISITKLKRFDGDNGPHNSDFDFRADCRTFVVRNHIANTFHPGNIGKAGYIQDWTEPIKEMCAWAGLTWEDAAPNKADPVLGKSTSGVPLRVWGDFEFLGAGPVVCTPGDYFMSKSFMDGIRQVSDFIGGVFYIDEGGGAQFRLPNIWTGGNFLDDSDSRSLQARFSGHPIEFNEDANLTSYQAVISDQSVRSEILVIGGYPGVNNAKGQQNNGAPVAGGYVLGYNSATHTASAINFDDVLAGQYRLTVLPGDATKLFFTEIECQRMAELTALFILFTYRQGSLSAPAHPGLQIDDQVRIFERTTYETNTHYVSSLKTHQDLESGEYVMTATTHWLGKDPNTDWFVNKAQLSPAVKSLPAIVKRIGLEAGANGDSFQQLPYGT